MIILLVSSFFGFSRGLIGWMTINVEDRVGVSLTFQEAATLTNFSNSNSFS